MLVSLSQNGSLFLEFLNQPKVLVKAKGKKSTARVLTNTEFLSLLIKKEKKKKEEEEAKEREKRTERGSKKKRKLRSSGKQKSRKRRKKKKQPRSNLRLPVE